MATFFALGIGIMLLFVMTVSISGLRAGNLMRPMRFLGSKSRMPYRPRQYHSTLLESDIKPRVIIVGDVHGCLDELQELLAKCDYNPKDSSVILVRMGCC
jgi:hypothetical protein